MNFLPGSLKLMLEAVSLLSDSGELDVTCQMLLFYLILKALQFSLEKPSFSPSPPGTHLQWSTGFQPFRMGVLIKLT